MSEGEYEGYREALPDDELRRHLALANSEILAYTQTREEIIQELSRRGLDDYVSSEVVE